MNPALNIPILLILGVSGGLIGSRVNLPAAPMIGAMMAIIGFKLVANVNWSVPGGFTLALQIFLGIMVGASFQPEMLQSLQKIIIPVLTSTLFLVGTGLVFSFILSRIGIMDSTTAYLGTSPGAMSVLIGLAIDNESNPMTVTCFHFFRVVFILLSTPLVFKYILKL
ncbi:MAG: AbrB family transcriptional regulator [Desulfobacterales bacterium]|nr:AbrB family transcriptional regulator [Desulfobacterales bacterium]